MFRIPNYRLSFLICCAVLALCASYAALVTGSASWAEARALDQIFPFYSWHIRPFTSTAWHLLRVQLGTAAAVLGTATLLLSFPAKSRREWQALGREVRQAGAALARAVAGLSRQQRRWALGLLALLTAVRVFFSVTNPGYDDAVSYEVFVNKGLLAVSSYYPIPNNHVFSNAISHFFHRLYPGFWWTMRLPVLLISTAATVFLFAALLRYCSFRVATLAVTLFSWLQLSLYHAGAGRGYWLVIALASLVFFCVLVLQSGAGPQRAAWLGLVLGCILGGYTVPTFAYAAAAAFAWLGLAALRRFSWLALLHLSGTGLLVAGGVLLLYTPLLFVSGPDALLGNGYVAALPAGAFWSGLPAYLWFNEGFLAGQRTLGSLITLVVLGFAARLFYLARQGRLPAPEAQQLYRLGLPALWFAAFPYLLVMVQRVFPPERTMLYKAFFFFILAGLAFDWWLRQAVGPAARRREKLLLGGLLVFMAFETFYVVRVNPAARGTNAAYHAGLQWLASRPPGPVLAPEPTQNLFFRFYAHSEYRQRPWQFDDRQQPGTQYSYVVAFPSRRGFFQPEFSFPPAYRNAHVEIYAVPPALPLRTEAWRH